MVLAREESIYTHEQIEKQEPQIRKNKRKKKNYKFEKIVIVAIIAVIFMCSILILTRFMAIAEARYEVSVLEKQLEDLESEKIKLKIEVEKVSKSKWIESEAKDRLQMDYPTPEQMISININPAKVAMLTNKMSQLENNNISEQEESNKKLYTFFEKLISYIRI